MNAPLSPAEAARVQRHHDRLMAALQARDRAALLSAKQEVLAGAFADPVSPALRRALRDLSWRMAGLLLPRGSRHGGIGCQEYGSNQALTLTQKALTAIKTEVQK